MYEHLIYGGTPFATMAAAAPAMKDRTLTMNGVSKAYAMTGWRIGYAAGPQPLIDAMALVQGQLTSGAARPCQWAAHRRADRPAGCAGGAARRVSETPRSGGGAAGRHPRHGLPHPAGRLLRLSVLRGISGKTTPKGKRIDTDEDFCIALLEEGGVATVHGAAFGQSPYFRVSYAASEARADARQWTGSRRSAHR